MVEPLQLLITECQTDTLSNIVAGKVRMSKMAMRKILSLVIMCD